jgi:hypothetical protein
MDGRLMSYANGWHVVCLHDRTKTADELHCDLAFERFQGDWQDTPSIAAWSDYGVAVVRNYAGDDPVLTARALAGFGSVTSFTDAQFALSHFESMRNVLRDVPA